MVPGAQVSGHRQSCNADIDAPIFKLCHRADSCVASGNGIASINTLREYRFNVKEAMEQDLYAVEDYQVDACHMATSMGN